MRENKKQIFVFHVEEPQENPTPSDQLDLLENIVLQQRKVSLDPSASGTAGLVPETMLILDTETTGLDPQIDHCLEVGDRQGPRF